MNTKLQLLILIVILPLTAATGRAVSFKIGDRGSELCITLFSPGWHHEETKVVSTKNKLMEIFDVAENHCDATRIKKGEVCTVGTLKKDATLKISPKDVISLLFESDTITTYWHITANLCLTNETTKGNIYNANFKASHQYCTNDCYSEKYSFSLSIDKNTGLIQIKGK